MRIDSEQKLLVPLAVNVRSFEHAEPIRRSVKSPESNFDPKVDWLDINSGTNNSCDWLTALEPGKPVLLGNISRHYQTENYGGERGSVRGGGGGVIPYPYNSKFNYPLSLILT